MRVLETRHEIRGRVAVKQSRVIENDHVAPHQTALNDSFPFSDWTDGDAQRAVPVADVVPVTAAEAVIVPDAPEIEPVAPEPIEGEA